MHDTAREPHSPVHDPADVDDTGDFTDPDDVAARLAEHGYIADRTLATAVYLSTRMGKPLLLEGPAGVGKTELAKTLAAATGRRLLRLQCYEGQDDTKALYEWDYGKQLLYVQLLRDKIADVVGTAPDLHTAVEHLAAQDSVFFSERFLAPRPLLDAVRSPEPVVLLIDEVDRSDEQLEAVFLEVLAEFQVSVPELGTFVAEHRPYVILTSNDTRDLTPALKRRCLHLSLRYPDAERELAIVHSKHTGLDDVLASQLVALVRAVRDLDLRKPPSISEVVDWARTLVLLNVKSLDASVLEETLSVVLKYERDVRRALNALPRLLAEATGAEARPHGHDHDHGHDHSHDHSHDHGHGPHSHSHGTDNHHGGHDHPHPHDADDERIDRGNLSGHSGVSGKTGYYGTVS